MSGVDIAIVVIILVSIVMGGFRGVVREAISLIGWVLGLWLAFGYHETAGHGLKTWRIHEALNNPVVANIAGFLMILMIVFLVIGTLSWLMRHMIGFAGLSPIDRILGLFFGFARGLLMVMLMVWLVEMSPLAKTKPWQAAQYVPPVKIALLVMANYVPSTF